MPKQLKSYGSINPSSSSTPSSLPITFANEPSSATYTSRILAKIATNKRSIGIGSFVGLMFVIGSFTNLSSANGGGSLTHDLAMGGEHVYRDGSILGASSPFEDDKKVGFTLGNKDEEDVDGADDDKEEKPKKAKHSDSVDDEKEKTSKKAKNADDDDEVEEKPKSKAKNTNDDDEVEEKPKSKPKKATHDDDDEMEDKIKSKPKKVKNSDVDDEVVENPAVKPKNAKHTDDNDVVEEKPKSKSKVAKDADSEDAKDKPKSKHTDDDDNDVEDKPKSKPEPEPDNDDDDDDDYSSSTDPSPAEEPLPSAVTDLMSCLEMPSKCQRYYKALVTDYSNSVSKAAADCFSSHSTNATALAICLNPLITSETEKSAVPVTGYIFETVECSVCLKCMEDTFLLPSVALNFNCSFIAPQGDWDGDWKKYVGGDTGADADTDAGGGFDWKRYVPGGGAGGAPGDSAVSGTPSSGSGAAPVDVFDWRKFVPGYTIPDADVSADSADSGSGSGSSGSGSDGDDLN